MMLKYHTSKTNKLQKKNIILFPIITMIYIGYQLIDIMELEIIVQIICAKTFLVL